MNIRVPILLVLKMLKETNNIYELPSEDIIFKVLSRQKHIDKEAIYSALINDWKSCTATLKDGTEIQLHYNFLGCNRNYIDIKEEVGFIDYLGITLVPDVSNIWSIRDVRKHLQREADAQKRNKDKLESLRERYNNIF